MLNSPELYRPWEHRPVDSHQSFSRARQEAEIIEHFANEDYEENWQDIYAMIGKVEVHERFYGYPVIATGGSMMVGSLDEELEMQRAIAPNNLVVEGEYQGLMLMTVIDPRRGGESTYKLFHAIKTGEPTTDYDYMGDRMSVTPITYVTATDSDIQVVGPMDAHSYEAISKDGFCAKIDELVFDENMTAQQIFHTLANMFNRSDTTGEDISKRLLDFQRISYLNQTEFISRLIAQTNWLFYKLGNFPDSCESAIAGSREQGFTVNVLSADLGPQPKHDPHTKKIVLSDDARVLYLRGESADFGEVLLPYMPTMNIFSVDDIEIVLPTK